MTGIIGWQYREQLEEDIKKEFGEGVLKKLEQMFTRLTDGDCYVFHRTNGKMVVTYSFVTFCLGFVHHKKVIGQ